MQKEAKNVGGRPKSTNPRVTFGCRLPPDTIAEIKRQAKRLDESDANVIVMAVERMANPIRVVSADKLRGPFKPKVVEGGARRGHGGPILKPSGKIT